MGFLKNVCRPTADDCLFDDEVTEKRRTELLSAGILLSSDLPMMVHPSAPICR